MAHDFPLTVYVVWCKDHILTDVEQRLAVFPKRKDAVAWTKKHGGSTIKKFTVERPPDPFSKNYPVLDRAIRRLNKSSREYNKAQQRGRTKVAAR